jgi:Response regulator containing CheY-like receiver, AAA-type ATPase, and DNA-binding domains
MHQGTLLIIDDEISIRESLALLFEDEGYRIFTAENGHVGLDLFFREKWTWSSRTCECRSWTAWRSCAPSMPLTRIYP